VCDVIQRKFGKEERVTARRGMSSDGGVGMLLDDEVFPLGFDTGGMIVFTNSIRFSFM